MTGVVLAGGLGRRMGGPSKPAMELAGEPLILRPLRALGEVCPAVAVVCKRDTRLPPLPDGVSRWEEPDEPRHPLVGLAHALRRAPGSVLACGADMPFVTGEALRSLIAAGEGAGHAPAVVACAGGRLQPLLGLYRGTALERLREAAEDARLTEVVQGLEPVRVSVDPGVVLGVNTPQDLAAARARLRGPTR